MTCASPGEQSSVVADLARSDPVVDVAGTGEVETEGREKGDDTGEELTDKSDAEEWVEEEVEVHEEEFVKTERIVFTDDVVIPQNLPEPERQRETPPGTVEAGLVEEALVQRVAVEDREELREDGFTVLRRVTTLYHVRTEFASPKSHGDEARKVERVLGTEVEEQVTELAPGVQLPYDDDAEVETTWDETEDCLPDGTWIKKKTTKTTVRPPPHPAVVTPVTRSPEGTTFLPSEEQSGLVDSGYRDETSHDLVEESVTESTLHVRQLEYSLPDMEEPEASDQEAGEPTVEMMPEIVRDHVTGKGTICPRFVR